MKRTLSPEELERNHIYDDATLCEGPFYDATDMPLKDFLKEARQLEKELKGQDYIFTPEGATAFLFWAFFNLGAWHGVQHYRAHIVAELEAAAGVEFTGVPETTPFKIDDGAVAGFVSGLDEWPGFAKALCSMFPLQVWTDEDEQ